MPKASNVPAQDSQFITRNEAAEMCAISVQLVDKFIKQERLTPYYFGRAVRLLREEWERLIEEAKIKKTVHR